MNAPEPLPSQTDAALKRTPFALARLSIERQPPALCLVVAGRALPMAALAGTVPALDGVECTLGFLRNWQGNLAALNRAIEQGVLDRASAASTRLSECVFHAPIAGGFALYCCTANHRQRLAQLLYDKSVDPELEGLKGDARWSMVQKMLERRAAQGEPYFYMKPSSTVTGPYDPVVIPPQAESPGAEVELGVVIGRPARNVRRDDAMDYVAGYTIVDNIGDKGLMLRSDFPGADWLRGNGSPTYTPIGPYIVPAQFVPDPGALDLRLYRNGEELQAGSTGDMLLKIPRLIQDLSHKTELRPGDVLTTGAPALTGKSVAPLCKGDVLACSISLLGEQQNRCI